MDLYIVRQLRYGSFMHAIVCRVLEARAFTEEPSRMRTSSVSVAFTLYVVI